jgi:L-cysteine:1D-myo-inositol 2-amino-2-deoxy-alpha-D-glucopyranoside ligase
MNASNGVKTFEAGSAFKMYVCGITPYDSTHLGHAATYLTFDLIHRYLRASGSQFGFVENVTDIDEPLLERASRDNLDWKQLAENQISLFKSDMTALHVLPPDSFVGATEVMDLVSAAISQMDRNGFVYKVDQDLYFDISSFLNDLPISLQDALEIFAERGGDPTRNGKRNPLDPILWKAHTGNEPGWKSVHGFGRPGWHIECCVISLRYLNGPDFMSPASGDTLIDIQGGGSDLLFPHHFMSAAQAQAMTGKTFAKAYIHAGMIGLDGEKMSKSKGNLVFVSKLIEHGFDPMAIRAALMLSHYAEDRMWTSASLQAGQDLISLVRSALSKTEVSPAEPLISHIKSALADNLDTPSALNALAKWSEDSLINGNVDEAGIVARALDTLLGLAL